MSIKDLQIKETLVTMILVLPREHLFTGIDMKVPDSRKGIHQAAEIFGEKAQHLQPLVPIQWKGNMVKAKYRRPDTGRDIDIIAVELNQKTEFALLTECIKVNTFGEIRKKTLESIKWAEKLCPSEGQGKIIQSRPIVLIDIKLKEPGLCGSTMEQFKEEFKEKLLNLLICPEEAVKDFDFDVYEIVRLARNRSLVNLSSLANTFISIHPKTALIVRNNNVEDKHVRAATLEALCVVAICFIRYTELLLELAGWEKKVFDVTKAIGEAKQGKEGILIKVTDYIGELIECHYTSSSLLQLHMSYVTSSAVGQNFFRTFSEISGLDEIHRSLLTKLGSCERLLNYLVDFYQFKEIKGLTGE